MYYTSEDLGTDFTMITFFFQQEMGQPVISLQFSISIFS